jgi:hypothetical protein
MPVLTTTEKAAYDAAVTAAATIKGAVGATDNAVVRVDGTGTRTIQGSLVAIDDSGNVSVPALATVDGRDVSVDGTKLDGISAGADVTSAALVAAGTTTAAVASTANKLELSPVSMGTITTGTTQPISFTDALFTGLVTGGTAVGSGGTAGVVAAAFGSSGAETGTGSGQGGLGSAAGATQPYNSTDFAGGRFHCDLFKSNSEPLVLSDVLTTAAASFPASVATPVVLYLSRRTDLGADAKWRGWFYFRNQATGNLTPVTPDISVATVTLRIPQVFLSKDVPTSALYTPIASLGSAEVVFGATGDIANLGTKAGGSSGKVADAAHVHTMPSADQLATCAGDVPFNAHKLTGVANPTAAQDVETKAYGDSRVQWVGAWGAVSAPATASTRFLIFGATNAAPNATEGLGMTVMPFAGTITGLQVRHCNGVLSTDSVAYTVRVEGADSTITCTVAAGGVLGSDFAHTVSVNAGDRVGIKAIQSSTQAGATINIQAAILVKTAAVG